MSLKLTVDGEAKEVAQEMIKQMKSDFPGVSISTSSLTSWILVYFFKRNFGQAKSRIADHHFNPKAYVRSQLKDLDSVEKVEAALSAIRAKMKNSKGLSEKKTEVESTLQSDQSNVEQS